MEIATSAAILEAITTRQSVSPKHLGSPGPTKDEIRRMVTAAVTAPDHGALRPWRFLLIADEARPHLADLFVAAKADKTPDMTPDMVEKERDKALCGPTLIAVTARINQRHPKVPASEQYASVGMAVQNLLLAANALGYGGILLSGDRVRDNAIRDAFAFDADDELIGFVTLGTPAADLPAKRRPDPDNHLFTWPFPGSI
ncbi:MAG: nitroreductase [Rhodospirillales bacterium]|nr:nitroreductase [Rhodospirillales bacterium]